MTYIAVHSDFRKRGIGTSLITELQRIVNGEALRATGKSIFGMVYEIEEEGKEGIKATVSKLGAQPLDIGYHQPPLRIGYSPERMDLWFQPILPLIKAQGLYYELNADIVTDMVRNMLTMEYVGPQTCGFDLNSKAYTAFAESLIGRRFISFKNNRA